jgi:membrane fusion protein (multidrug efflux system)
LVPQRATTRGPDGGLSVWVVGDDNKASPRKIEVSDAHEGNWIVNSGLNSGERVVIEGYQKISPGAEVKTTPWEQDSSGQK